MPTGPYTQQINPYGGSYAYNPDPYGYSRTAMPTQQSNSNSLMTVLVSSEDEVNNYPVAAGFTVMLVDFSPGEISLAIVIDGTTVPSSTMIATPAAVEEYSNVAVAVSVPVWSGCCETLSIRNTSDQPILVQNANVILTRSNQSVVASC